MLTPHLAKSRFNNDDVYTRSMPGRPRVTRHRVGLSTGALGLLTYATER